MHTLWRRRTSLISVVCLCSITLSVQASAQTYTTTINVPPDADPRTIGSDTQLNLFAGGLLAEQFVAGNPDGTSNHIEVNINGGEVGVDLKAYNSMINIGGGTVGRRLSLYQSTLNISGGEVVTDANTFEDAAVIAYDSRIHISGGVVGTQLIAHNSILDISDGELGSNARVFDGTTVNVSGGIVKDSFRAFSGSIVNITGGTVNSLLSFSEANISGDAWVRGVIANSGSTINISGGTVGNDLGGPRNIHSIIAQWNSTFNITGGDVGSNFDVVAGSTINLTGTSFILDGIDLTQGLIPGEVAPITAQNVAIEGLLADGSPFSFFIETNTTVLPDAIWTVTLVPEPGTMMLIGIGALGILRRRSIG